VNKLAIKADMSQTGLCFNCEYARHVESKETTVYFLCERSLTDPTFPKYPRLPVLRCSGYVKFQDPEYHEGVSLPTAPATTEKKCPRCGTLFTCYQQEECWCANVRLSSPALDALRARFADCVCEACLKNEAFQSPPLGSGPE
jgi:cysteine-rich CWC protein